MGIKLEQLVNSLNTSKEYHEHELVESERRTSTLIQALYEVITNDRDDALHVLKENIGLEDTPVGHILTYMGWKAPKHYLICDGAEYNIADYPMLSKHIFDEFGAVNYFGGNGETTFCVPDLRGEFLRGTGTADRDTGTGANVGAHQDATEHPWTETSASGGYINVPHGETSSNKVQSVNTDTYVESVKYLLSRSAEKETLSNRLPARYTSRPTNTAVLFCIKYEPTFYLRAGSDTDYYSTEETCIGTWINGKPLYRKVMSGKLVVSTQDAECSFTGQSSISDIDTVVDLYGTVMANGGTLPIPFVHSVNTDYCAGIFLDAKGIVHFRFGGSRLGTYQCQIIVVYTKKSVTQCHCVTGNKINIIPIRVSSFPLAS
ncbi:MAG: phage tail protein [Lachnospiraceae bacterium]|nr:phage tail protein [Lachnospiraceae bacterium]